MIIKDKGSRIKPPFKLIKWLVAAIVFVVLAWFVVYPFVLRKISITEKGVYFCDAEKIWRGKYVSNGEFFTNASTQSDQDAYAGIYSSFLGKGKGYQWGMGIKLKNIKAGETYEVSVWRKTKGNDKVGTLVFAGPEGSGFHKSSNKTGRKIKNGWGQIKFNCQIPKHFNYKTISVYTYTQGEAETYFDDLRIEKITDASKEIPIEAFEPQMLKLEMSAKAYNKLKIKRGEAYKKGLLITDDDSWVKAGISNGEEKVPVKLRLKGDWLDHLTEKKWSFRIKVKAPNAWNQMLTFSVQNPMSRYYALEWLLHKMWEAEDVLTTRYDFITLALNGDPLGIYAYEEHFEKQLVEYKNRREGPILRFVEDGLWDTRLSQIKSKLLSNREKPQTAEMANAEIEPFKENKVIASETLSKQFKIAQSLMYKYQQGEATAAEIFDLPRMARYNAISDLFGAYHGLIWHNQRFYYNPVIGKLEPIGFDGFANKPRKDPLLLGKAMIENGAPSDVAALKKLYEDEAFIELYMEYLYQFTSAEYLESFFESLDGGLQQRIDFLKNEFPQFSYQEIDLFRRARHIQYLMMPFDKHSVKSYWTKDNKEDGALELSNIHAMPLEVLGTGTRAGVLSNNFEKNIHLAAFRMGTPRAKRLVTVPTNSKFVFYKPYGIDTLFSTPIGNWVIDTQDAPPTALFKNVIPKTNDLYEVIGQKIYFRKGKQTVSKDVLIPAGFEVYFPEGTQLDFIRQAKFISYSPVFMNGTADDPIFIQSSDHSANGFTVLQAPQGSTIFYVVFDGLNTLDYRGWTLTGAVTFYESDVTIKNSVFKENVCEDGLNLIRSKFKLEESIISETFGDGFDADFCEGDIYNCHFRNTGNDGIDVSGSKILIAQTELLNCGDKGISVGEESNVTARDCLIDGAVIGTASKDMSYLLIEHIKLKNCNQGFAAYQKKPEFGPSTIIVNKYFADEVKYLHTIATRCTLELNNQMIIGD